MHIHSLAPCCLLIMAFHTYRYNTCYRYNIMIAILYRDCMDTADDMEAFR
jgi:hypothetical protein